MSHSVESVLVIASCLETKWKVYDQKNIIVFIDGKTLLLLLMFFIGSYSRLKGILQSYCISTKMGHSQETIKQTMKVKNVAAEIWISCVMFPSLVYFHIFQTPTPVCNISLLLKCRDDDDIISQTENREAREEWNLFFHRWSSVCINIINWTSCVKLVECPFHLMT